MTTYDITELARAAWKTHGAQAMSAGDLYSEWRAFYAEKVRSWMSLEELRAECGKLTTTDGTSPELLLIHAMHALEECVQRDKALLRQALDRLEAVVERFDPYIRDNECRPMENARSTITALRERLGEGAEP